MDINLRKLKEGFWATVNFMLVFLLCASLIVAFVAAIISSDKKREKILEETPYRLGQMVEIIIDNRVGMVMKINAHITTPNRRTYDIRFTSVPDKTHEFEEYELTLSEPLKEGG